jgi:hypothetical protein
MHMEHSQVAVATGLWPGPNEDAARERSDAQRRGWSAYRIDFESRVIDVNDLTLIGRIVHGLH